MQVKQGNYIVELIDKSQSFKWAKRNIDPQK